MVRGARLCRRCGGTKRGSRAANSQPIADCAECGDPVCFKHAIWDSALEAYRCSKCTRKKPVR